MQDCHSECLRQITTLLVETGMNFIVFAFRDECFQFERERTREKARILQRKYPLPMARLVEKLLWQSVSCKHRQRRSSFFRCFAARHSVSTPTRPTSRLMHPRSYLSLKHHRLDLGNGLGGIESLRASLRTVHDRMATV